MFFSTRWLVMLVEQSATTTVGRDYRGLEGIANRRIVLPCFIEGASRSPPGQVSKVLALSKPFFGLLGSSGVTFWSNLQLPGARWEHFDFLLC